ncbi:MAG TPA: hypothetical protein VMR21_02790, partial [Vicinamibacteria bacterium]|nr:hypothetical protein [Vicinamibacteria bacterium]
RLLLATLWLGPAAWLVSGGLARRAPARLPGFRRRAIVLAAVALLLAVSWSSVIPVYLLRLRTALLG